MSHGHKGAIHKINSRFVCIILWTIFIKFLINRIGIIIFLHQRIRKACILFALDDNGIIGVDNFIEISNIYLWDDD